MQDKNPLLEVGLPPFDRILAEHVEPAMRTHLAKLRDDLAALEASARPTWDGVARPLGALLEPTGWAWNVVGHLMSVLNSEPLRVAHDAVQPEVVETMMRVGMSVPIYKALKGIDRATLDGAQRRIVDAAIRDAELSGVGLDGEARARFEKIELELAELTTKFSNNLLDASKAWSLHLTDQADLDGLPPTLLAMSAQLAKAAGQTGWRITLDQPVMGPFLEHSRRRDLREQVYRASVTRASTGTHDNQPLIDKILALRQEKAKLLGYPSYAEVSLASKMAPSVAAIEKLLGELHDAAYPKAAAELAELETRAGARLSLWDVAYWAERVREERYAYTDEELRPYFALPRVLDGLFATAKRLFGVTIRAADGDAPVWHPDVRYFQIFDDDRAIASFYLDPYSRSETKRGGAWMNSALERKRLPDGELRLPIAYLICNFTPPVGDKPALLTFREVETLFHEFGHGLQHMLTTVEYVEAAGISNIEWDAVELPSQFMENWCFHRPTLMGMARHLDTGAALPDAMFEKIVAARNYRAGSQTLRQVYFATLDLELHRRLVDNVLDVQRRVADANTILKPLAEDRFLCGFAHIFAGGYAAGYYSYKWAEVLSADAFGAFQEAGLDRPEAVAATGRRFRQTILSLGGSRHPLEVFKEFRGREPSVRPLLEQTGLVELTNQEER
jgi:oligopeptidase A